MDPELQRIDKLLDDEALVDAVVEKLRQRSKNSRKKGRPSTPAEVVLRMLVLKHLRGWSYDRLQWEVTGNIAYRQFCRIGAERVPDAKTLVRLGQLLGDSVLQTLCDRLVQVAVERKVTQGRKMRVDTTVVEAPIAYPTASDARRRPASDAGRTIRTVGVRLPPTPDRPEPSYRWHRPVWPRG